MKRILCIFLTVVCVFTLGSCEMLANFKSFEQTDTDTSTTADATTPEADDNVTTVEPEVTTPAPEVTTPAPEVTTPAPEVTTPAPEVTTPAPDDNDSLEKPEDGVLDVMVNKLALLESLFQKDSRGWCMYNDIMGSAVTEVLSKQEHLIAGGCNANDIYLAGTATENLRVLLKGYSDLRTAKYQSDYEKYKALYEYYTTHYDALEQNFCDLYKTLKGLYGNTVVSNYIAIKGKSEHYRQIVGHLFVISTALDQTVERDEDSWRMDRKTLHEVIEDIHYLPDGDWYPHKITMPSDLMVNKLALLESLFQKDSRGWCMYNDIMGAAVTEVLSKQDLLIAGGANRDDVRLAGVATENLRVLLKGYNDLRTAKYQSDHDKYTALYQFYADNYDAFEQNFCDLYKTLKGLYGNSAISGYIASKERTEHYRQLVGHLFVISTALDQTVERDEDSWRMDRKTLHEVIEDIHYLPDGDWYPQVLN